MAVKYKILLIGNDDVGKRSWLSHFPSIYRATESRTHMEINLISFPHIGPTGVVQLEIWTRWDQLYHHEHFNVMNYYNDVDGIIGLFDVTQSQSYDSLIQLMDQTKQNCNLVDIHGINKIKFAIFVGNKCDLLDKKQYTVTYPFADYFISAKTKLNYKMPFLHVIKILRNEPSLRLVDSSSMRVPEAKHKRKHTDLVESSNF